VWQSVTQRGRAPFIPCRNVEAVTIPRETLSIELFLARLVDHPHFFVSAGAGDSVVGDVEDLGCSKEFELQRQDE
jgi:hypothetical protein